VYGIDWWYCCLNPRERSVLHSMAVALPLTLFLGVPVEEWDLFWLATFDDHEAYRAAFLSIYMLEIVTIGVDDEEVSVVRPRDGGLPFWVGASLFILTPSAACLTGCGQSRVPG